MIWHSRCPLCPLISASSVEPWLIFFVHFLVRAHRSLQIARRKIKIWRCCSSGAEAVLDGHQREANSEHAASAFDEAAAPGQHRYLPTAAFFPKIAAPVSGALPWQAVTLDVTTTATAARGFRSKTRARTANGECGGAAGQTLGTTRRQEQRACHSLTTHLNPTQAHRLRAIIPERVAWFLGAVRRFFGLSRELSLLTRSANEGCAAILPCASGSWADVWRPEC